MMIDEKKENKPKEKIKLFDYIFESSIKSSLTILQIVNELILLTENLRSIRDTLLTLSKVLQIHQTMIEDMRKAIEQIAAQDKKSNNLSLTLTKDPKKDKLN
jgi:hypothetical protein